MLDERKAFEDFILSLTKEKIEESRTELGYQDRSLHLLYLVYLTNIHRR